MNLGDVVLTTRFKEEKYNREGERVASIELKSVRGRTMVFLSLGSAKPTELNVEWVTSRLKEISKAGFEEYRGQATK